MVSTLSRQEKFNQVRRNFCFYLDIHEHELCRSISRRLQDMGLQQEQVLSARVTHVVRGGAVVGVGEGEGAPRWRREPARARADAMLERARRPTTQHTYVLLSVEKAIALLDKLYDTFFTAPKANIRLFTKHYIKIEFLDKAWRPLYKEFDELPSISIEPNRIKERKEGKEPSVNQGVTVNNNFNNTIGQNCEMTRKNRPRIKEKEDAEPGGYCSLCGCAYTELASHEREPQHAAIAREHGLLLDTWLGPAALNGERRSLRHNMCNGGSPPPPAPVATAPAPAHGDDEPRRTRCRRAADADDRQYYKVVGVSTKLRSSGGFVAKRKDSSPTCNGAKPLVVKFRKVRRSELSVLSDEAEQFMFPKRASSSGSTSSSSSDDEKEPPRRKSPPVALERRRQARPTALKEDSSEEDSWPDDARRRKRRIAPVARRTRRTPCRPPTPEPEPPPEAPPVEVQPPVEPEPVVSPLREEPVEKCMKWEDGRLKYTPAVEQLEFAFESVPRSEPWFETFERQDRDRVTVKNVPRCFALYSTSPKLPYELGQLPPLKPDCCPLSALPAAAGRRADPRPERYGTRGLKSRAQLHRRLQALAAHDPRPRKSPREHASTLAMLGAAGPPRRRADDAKSTASEDTLGDRPKPEPEPAGEARDADDRLRAFLAGVFDDAADYDVDAVEGGALPAAAAAPDVVGLVSECDACDIIRDEIAEGAAARRRRRGRVRKKNRTGWPSKRRPKKGSRAGSSEDPKTESSLDRSSIESSGARDTCDEDDRSETERDEAPRPKGEVESEDEARVEAMDVDGPDGDDERSDDKPLRLDVKVLVEDEKEKKPEKVKRSRSSASEVDDREERIRNKKKRALGNLASWLQPVVRVARVDPAAARRLRSAAQPKTRSARLR